MQLVPGALIRENLRLHRPLGEGAMGSVWVAEHLGLHTEVAVKFVHADLARQEPRALERFNREAAAAARIKSPHVVQIFDKGITPDGRPFIVMELLRGETLLDRIARTGPLAIAEACEVVGQVAKALERAHREGIIHRDIKPENVFLVDDADSALFAKVLDFGIAKHSAWEGSGKLTHPEHLVGTPAYMSRDRILGSRPLDLQADLWSLAVLAYEAITGELPFGGATMAEICVAICQGEFPPPSRYRPGLGARLDAFFARALHVDAERRFASARELALAFLLAATVAAEGADAARDLSEALGGSGKFSMPLSVRPLALSSAPARSGPLGAVQLGFPRRDTPTEVVAAAEPGAPAPSDSGPGSPMRDNATTLVLDPGPAAPPHPPSSASHPTIELPEAFSSPETFSGKASLSLPLAPGGSWPKLAVGAAFAAVTGAVLLALLFLLRGSEARPDPAAPAAPEVRQEPVIEPGDSEREGEVAVAAGSAASSAPSGAAASASAPAPASAPPPAPRAPPRQRPEDVLGF